MSNKLEVKQIYSKCLLKSTKEKTTEAVYEGINELHTILSNTKIKQNELIAKSLHSSYGETFNIKKELQQVRSLLIFVGFKIKRLEAIATERNKKYS